MGDTIEFQISIPTDNEGFLLMKCPICREYFKLKPSDFEDDRIFDIHCPACGLVSESYIADDVIELAMNMAENYANDLISKELKKMEMRSKGLFKVTSTAKRKPEEPIKLSIVAMQKKLYPCCKMEAKIKPILKMSGNYCPFCGVKDYGVE